MTFMSAMRKVEASNAHACIDERNETLNTPTGRAESENKLCPAASRIRR
jgi:hypothetical protein